MKNYMPKIGIAMPSYNSGKYINDAITSIMGQTYENIVTVIVDDGSTDNTYEVLEKLYRPDFAIIHHFQNEGYAKSVNDAADLCISLGCDYIFRMDSDDRIYPTCIEKMVNKIQNHDCDWVNCYLQKFGTDNGVLTCETEVSLRRILSVNPLTTFALFKVQIWKEFGGYDENLTPEPLKAGYEDWDLWIRLIRAKKKYKVIEETLYYYRMHDKKFGDIANAKRDYLYKILEDKHK